MPSEVSTKDAHSVFIRRNFNPPLDLAGIHERGIHLLTKYGTWLRALSEEKIQPLTADQERFVRVAHGELAPVSEFEKLWMKYTQLEKDCIDKIRILLQEGSLGYKQLSLILDTNWPFGFTEQELLIMRQQHTARTPSLGGNWFIEYSSTDGQD